MFKEKIFWFLIPLLIVAIILCESINNAFNENPYQRESIKVYTPQGEVADSYSTYDELLADSTADYVDGNDTIAGNNTTPNGTVKGSYFGNKNSKVFHKSNCGVAKNTKEENRVYFSTSDEYLSKGYSPCKSCNP